MKKTLKKMLAGVLIAVLCVSSFAINASAATAEDTAVAAAAQDSAVAANAEENEVAAAAVEEPVAANADNGEAVGAKNINTCDISVSLNSYVHDGTRKIVTIVVKDGNKTLNMGTDYTVGGPPIYFGTQPVIINGQGNYTGSVTKYVTVTKPIDRCDITVSLNSYVYDGTRKTLTVVVKDGTKTLEAGKDYSIGGPPISSGTQPVIINGMGNYTGSVTKYVTIQPVYIPTSDISVTVSGVNGYLDPETNKVRNAVNVSVIFNGKTRNLINGSNYTIEYTDYNSGVVSGKITLCGGFSGTANTGIFYPGTPSFVWGRDNFQFINGGNSSGLVYDVDGMVFNSMAKKYHLTEAEKTTLINRIATDSDDGMDGRCNGMSTTCILAKYGFLKLSDFLDVYNDIYLSDFAFENTEERTMVSVINFMQEMWGSISYRKIETDASGLYYGNKDRFKSNQGTYIKKIATELEEGKTLLKLFYETERGPHAVVAYGVEPYQHHSEKTGKDYNYRILLYNPNSIPAGNTLFGDSCIYFNKPESGNDNEYYYEMFGTDYYWSVDDQHYGGIFGAFKYYSLTDEQNILNTKYSKCFEDWVDGTINYNYRIIVPNNNKKVLIGDATLDGKVTINDGTDMQRYLAEMKEYNDLQLINGDANLDGRIDVRDVTYLSRKLAGLIV